MIAEPYGGESCEQRMDAVQFLIKRAETQRKEGGFVPDPDRPVILDGSYIQDFEIEFPARVTLTMMEDPGPREVGELINILRLDCLRCDTLEVQLDIGTKPLRLLSHSADRPIIPLSSSSGPVPDNPDQAQALPVEYVFTDGFIRVSPQEMCCVVLDHSIMSEIVERK